MKSAYDHLYLSPHFDDAALSCGGQIATWTAAGQSVLVVTITGGDPPADAPSDTVRQLHDRWTASLTAEGAGGAAEAMVAQRRAEDRAALAVLGADWLHLPFLDCIYRCGPDDDALYPGPTDMFGPANPADAATLAALAEAFAALPAAGRVYLPLGVGGHVDHLATRRAAERVFTAPLYYEEYPYTAWPGALAAALWDRPLRSSETSEVWLDAAALATKIAAVAAYASQLSSFFTGPDDLAAKLADDGRRVMADALADGEGVPAWAVGGERLRRWG
ncbi:MAG: PIG-L family deacetylase [Candidatus Promineofilum sp.]|nr:PIG-L family deacetylase [Promineifilum sp.]